MKDFRVFRQNNFSVTATLDLILKKRDGGELTREEIDFLVKGAAENTIPDYQLSAWLMAVWFRGMTASETLALTDAMARSGHTADLSSIPGVKVDKHSTGGVGDKTTLVVAPLAAAGGVPVAKMSGRGLGFTGGTIDKLESIPGFMTGLSPERFRRQVREIGIALTGTGSKLAPADKRLYAIRDVTGTVDSIPLIAASVMSKKLAGGADAFVLDVKCGSGAFMKSEDDARALAQALLEIARLAGKKAAAFITAMDEPLGVTVGNALEVAEAIEVLKGKGSEDLRELSLTLAGAMLWLGEKAQDLEQGKAAARQLLDSGAGLEKLRQLISAQKGNPEVVDNPDLLPTASLQESLPARCDGFLQTVNAEQVGRAAMALGAGRAHKDDLIDPAAGIHLNKKIGDAVAKGESLAVLHASNRMKLEAGCSLAAGAFTVGDTLPDRKPLIRWLNYVSY